MEALGGVASIIAVVDLSAKILSLCSQYLKEVKNARNSIEDLQKAVTNVQTQHEKTRALLEGRMGFVLETSQQLIKGHHGCKKELEELMSKLERHLNTSERSSKIMRKFGRRALKWPFEATTVHSAVQKLREFQEDINKGLIIDQIGLELSQVEHSLLDSISSIPYDKHHNNSREKRSSGTCEWLLLHENFMDWQKTDSQVILWLQGQVGVGKTCLVSKTVDHMKTISETSPHNEIFAFFYCNHQEESRQKPLPIFQCLLRQLLLSYTGHNSVRQELYDRWETRRPQELSLNLEDCQEYLCRLINKSTKTSIILDAIDECEPSSRRRIIEGFKTLLTKCHKPLRILVSSRPERDIGEKLSTVSNIQIHKGYNEADIRAFVKEEIVNHDNWSNMQSDIQLSIEQTILDQSHGMFQWAALQVQHLLEQESISNIKQRLGRLPDTLKETYDELFAAIRVRDGTDRCLAENALRWVMCAVAPLRKEDLLSAIRLKIENDEFVLLEKITEVQLLKLCNHLLVLDTDRDVWKFAHFSVAEYLEGIGFGIRKSHSDVAKACLKLLNQTVVDFDHDETTSKLTSEVTATDDIFRKNHPVQVYSRHHWIVHAQTQESSRQKGQDDEGKKQPIDISLTHQLQDFMGSFDESSPQYRCWLRHVDSDEDPPRTSALYCLYEETYYDRLPNTLSDFKSLDTVCPASASILLASRFSLYELLKDWWDADYDLFQTNHNGSNLLVLAAAGGSVPLCGELLRRGINVETQRTNCVDALAKAVDHGHIDVVKLLIGTGKIDPNVRIRSNGNILVRAILEGQLETIRTIVQEGRAAVNAVLRDDNYGMKLDSIRWIFPVGTSKRTDQLLARRCYGSALAAAAGTGHLGVVKFLVQEGQADVNKLLKFGVFGNALTAAAHTAHLEIVKFLVQVGRADVDRVLKFGIYGSALAAAAQRGNLEVMKFLIREGRADVNMPLHGGRYGSALAAAVQGGNLKAAKFLIQEGHAHVNMPLKYGKYGTALASAAGTGKLEIIKFLVEDCGARIDLPEMVRLYGPSYDAIEAARKSINRKRKISAMNARLCLEFLEEWTARHALKVGTGAQLSVSSSFLSQSSRERRRLV